jgi:hypothetical protein
MSSISPGTGSATIESLLQLADFIRHPEYIDRVRELQAAQQAHDSAAQEARDRLAELNSAQHKLETERREFEAAKSAAFQQAAKAASDLKMRETALTAAEHDFKQRENTSTSRLETAWNIFHAREEKNNQWSVDLHKREAAVKKREEEMASLESRINRRLAKMREAEAI